jgi:hypothetical protein
MLHGGVARRRSRPVEHHIGSWQSRSKHLLLAISILPGWVLRFGMAFMR